MTRRLPLRAGLVAVTVAVLLGAFLSVPTIHSSYAQAPVVALAEPATAAPADAPAPACDAKTLTNCSPNLGDTAWMLMSVVLMMTVPGLGLFYGGIGDQGTRYG